ncbi:hypothetical protein BJ508DRAFT_326676 [Ascobolus immersus RN42]|uniref:Uncharacterized protein n=1 Tax=Ascobolus immersus RN42 TaxID=1160509 RepID=A0A3N4I4P1_ASCIM|nr:hypothetical protein BJ508DRAFT_326676 [Ascobolus immersus RN42]
MLREEQVKQREYFASNPPLMDETHMEIYRSLVEERRLESRNRELRSSFANDDGLDDPWNLQFRLHEFLIFEKCSDSHIEAAKAKTEALLTAARQTREQWKETDERWIAARDFEGPGREVYNLLLVEEARLKELEDSISRMQANLNASMAAAVAELDAQVAMGVSGSALDVFQRAANEASRAAEMGVPLSAFRQQRSAAAAATTAVDVALQERGQTREMWEKGKVEWNRQFHYDQLGKLKEIYSRLLRTAASRTLEMRTVKAHSFGQKQAKALMGGIFKKRAGMAKDIDLFNKILEDIPSEHAPHKLKPEAFNGADDLTPGLHSERARDALFHLHVLRSDLLGTLDGPQSYWARSAYVRIGISQLLKRDRCEEELVMLKNEWRRNLCYTQDLLTGMATFVESDDPEQVPFRLAVCKMLWDELEGAFVLIRAAGNMARRFGPDVFPLHGLEAVVGRVRLLLEKFFHKFDDEGIGAWVAPGSRSTLPSDLKAEQVDAKREELFPTDGVPMGDFHAHDREVSDDDGEVDYEDRMKTERAVSLEMLRVAERLEAVQIDVSG